MRSSLSLCLVANCLFCCKIVFNTQPAMYNCLESSTSVLTFKEKEAISPGFYELLTIATMLQFLIGNYILSLFIHTKFLFWHRLDCEFSLKGILRNFSSFDSLTITISEVTTKLSMQYFLLHHINILRFIIF